jgi:hypothetical protein
MDELRDTIVEFVSANRPCTVRQVFYHLVARTLIKKTRSEYTGVACRLTKELRESGDVPWSWIADNTRWMRKPDTFDSLAELIDITSAAYRRAIWTTQPVYVEVWLEKDALSGVFYPITKKWDVPLMVTRGYASLSFLYEAARTFSQESRPCYVYHFGDHDAAGFGIERQVELRLTEFAPEAEITFQRVAVTPEQIAEWNLPGWGSKVELDAIPPAQLRELVEHTIAEHIDTHAFLALMAAEHSEQSILERIVELAEVEIEAGGEE